MSSVATNDTYEVNVIRSMPGERNDWHYHLRDEMWFVAEGSLRWYIEGASAPVEANAGDFVIAPANRYHQIESIGDSPSTRVVICFAGHSSHLHGRDDEPPAPMPPSDNWL
jgi:mannose-6-phosphate isomerase-like protein (cupin superfamily)